MVIDKYVLDIFPDSSFLLLMLSSLSEVGSFAGGRKFWIMGLARENNCFKRVIPCIKPHSGGNDIPERSIMGPGHQAGQRTAVEEQTSAGSKRGPQSEGSAGVETWGGRANPGVKPYRQRCQNTHPGPRQL